MRYHIFLTALMGLGLVVGPAAAQTQAHYDIVEKYYERYLQRPADPVGMQTWAVKMANGLPVLAVKAGILGSDEFYQIQGSNPTGFVVGLYQNVLGRQPNSFEIQTWLNYLNQVQGDRQQTASTFLVAARGELAQHAARFIPHINPAVPPPLPVPPGSVVPPWPR
jgi:hypothetical protein